MRKIILNIAVSLDGFIEGPAGEIDWCFTDQDYGMRKFLSQIDTIFWGRKSYQLVFRTTPNPYPDKINYVFSRTLRHAAGSIRLINAEMEKAVSEILRQEGKDIWLFGGANLFSTLLNARLVHEMHLAIHPILLGGGKPLFENLQHRSRFEFVRSKPYATGLVQLFYKFPRK